MPFDPDRLDRRDPAFIRTVLPAFRLFARRFVRLQREGLENVPTTGPALLVGNHNGGIAGPDLPCTLATLWDRLGPEAPLYALAHDFAMRQFLPLGRLLQRIGAIRACHDNALRALASGGHVLVFPGGDIETYRHSRRKDEIVFGRRTGFVRVALQAGAPIVPIVTQGAHRSARVLTEGESFARLIGLPRWGRLERFPVAVAAPWGLALGPWTPWAPLPFPVRMRILPAITLAPGTDPDDGRELVRGRMQAALDEMVREAAA